MKTLIALTAILITAFAAVYAAGETETPPALPTAHTTRNTEGGPCRFGA